MHPTRHSWHRRTADAMVWGMETDARVAARRYYCASDRCLEADLTTLAQNPGGLIIYTPRLVVLAKPVLSHEPRSWELLAELPLAADGWYVHLLVGDVERARQQAAHVPPLRWLCFQRGLRNTRPHVLAWQRFLHPTTNRIHDYGIRH